MILGALFLLLFSPSAQAQKPLKVTFRLNWLPNGTHIGFFAARAKGFYGRELLDVNIVRGSGSRDALHETNLERADFCLAETASLIEQRSRGKDVVGVGVIFERNPSALFTLEGAGIKSPKDLAGKSIGAPEGSFPRLIFPLLAERTGLDLAGVKWMNLRPESLLEALISAKVEAVVSYTTALWQYQHAAKEAGLKVVSLPYADYGLNLYSLSLVTTDFRIRNKEPMVRAFVSATYRGLAWSAEHPEEALELFLKEEPGLDRERVEAEWREALRLMLPRQPAEGGFGRYQKDRLAEIKAVMVRWRRVKRNLPLESLYTNDYLPALRVKPKGF